MYRFVVLLSIGMALFVTACSASGESGSDASSATPVQSVATTIAPSTASGGQVTPTSTTAAVDSVVFEWVVSDPGEGTVVDVVEAGDGLVGVRLSGVSDGFTPLAIEIIMSGYGLEWLPIPDSPVAEGESVAWMSGNQWGVVGVVVDPEGSMDDPDFILSPDGRTWTRTNPISVASLSSGVVFVVDMVWGEPGIVAVLASDMDLPTPTTSLYFSETGETWALIEGLSGLGPVRTILAAQPGFVVVEELDNPGAPGLGGWISSDAESWERVTIADVIISGSGGSTGWRDGFVVVRDVFDPAADAYGPRMWQSSDGLTWSESITDPYGDVLSSGYEESLQGSDLGLFTVGETAHDHESEDIPEIEQFLMFSSDGTNWAKWNTKDLFGGASSIGGYAVGSESIVVLLVDEEASDFGSGEIVTILWVGRPGT